MTATSIDERIGQVHRDATVINGLTSLLRPPGSGRREFVLPRLMTEGGVTAINYTLAVDEDFKTTARLLSGLLDAVESAERPGARIVRTVEDIRLAKELGEVGIVIGLQGSEPIDGSLEFLRLLYRLGLRIMQLTYQRRNLVGDGCGEPADAGLSLFGRDVVKECNRLGILIDLSHTGYRSTMEAIELSTVPVAFTHVNIHSINPQSRNKTDEQIAHVAQRGGIVGINAIARLLSPTGRERGATLSEYIDQIEYVVNLVGIDHVGVGIDVVEDMTVADFESRRQTFFAQFPELTAGGDFQFEHYYVDGLRLATMPVLTDGLLSRGFSDSDITKIIGANFLRVFEAAWAGGEAGVETTS